MKSYLSVFAFFLSSVLCASAVDAQAIDDLLSSIPTRQDQALADQFNNTFPTIRDNSGSNIIMWNRIDYALAAYWLNQDTTIADAGLISLLNDVVEFANPGNGGTYNKTAYQENVHSGNFHWNCFLLARIYFYFSSNSTHFPGRMSAAAEDAVLQMMWDWLLAECLIEFADPAVVHLAWGSENHDAQQWVSLWSACQIFKDLPSYQNLTFADGSTPIQNAAAFDEYFKIFFRERSLKGGTVELGSPTYVKYTLNSWLNLYDFAEDPELKNAADMLLDIYWADWALEQLDGQRGGSRHRNYPGDPSISQTGGAGHSWVLFNIGVVASKHPGDMNAHTTSWRPSRATMALVLGSDELGTYQYTSRRLGVRDPNPPPFPGGSTDFNWNPLNPKGGSLLRTTWRTPDFVMGMSQVELLEEDEWIPFSSQNRLNNVIFSGQPEARIFTQRPYPGTPASAASETNAEWGVQNKGVMILQRITKHKKANGQAVWFDFDLSVSEINGWIFAVSTDAYAAVRIVDGGWNWVADSLEYHRGTNENLNLGEWAELIDEYSPIIIEVARKNDYSGYTAFRNEILSNPLVWDGTRLDYTSTQYGTTLTLFADESAPPQIDGEVVDLSPTKNYDSPYLQGDFAGGPVIIGSGENRIVHGVAPFADDARTFGLWHFDALVSGTDVEDDTSVTGRAAVDATVHTDSTNSITVITDGQFGSAIRCAFEAGDQYLLTTGAGDWPADFGTIRYQGWIRLNPGDTGGTLFHVYDQVTLTVSPTEVSFSINLSGDLLDSSSTNLVTLSAAIESSNDWQYIEAVYDGERIQLITEEEVVSALGIGEFIPDNRSVYIGSHKNTFNYVGDLDEVKLSTFIRDGVTVSASAENLQNSTPDIITNTITGFSPGITGNSKLVVLASWEQGTAGIAGVTYAGLDFTEVISSAAGRQSSIWYLDLDAVSPATGDVVVTFNIETDSRIGVLSLINAASGAPVTTVANSATPIVTLNHTTYNSLSVGVYTENGNGALSSNFANTLYSGNSGSSVGNAGYQLQGVPGDYTYTWANNETNPVIAAAVFAPAPFVTPTATDYDSDGMNDAWEVEKFGTLGASDGSGNTDGDRFTDLEEFIAGTNPRDADSQLRVSSMSDDSISWTAVQGKTYRVWSKTNLQDLSWNLEAFGTPGTPPENVFPMPSLGPQGFFIIEVE
jgi:hypothetical protein